MVAMIAVRAFPPKLGCSNRVSFEFLYGMWSGLLCAARAGLPARFELAMLRTLRSASFEITLPSMSKLTLILVASLVRSASKSLPDFSMRSDPARSTKFKVDTCTDEGLLR